MTLVMEAPPLPLHTSENGTIYIGTTRIPLDTVVYAFNQGASAEAIALSYPTLDLNDVYAVINYYLYNRHDVDEYIQTRQAHAEQVKQRYLEQFPQHGIRERLLARRKNNS
ncbi:MAG: DUF433 domain-containing protein [Herpetosiphon sp.]|nr:DUF433 domain-containing protein [Herpetosiphon sp.]